MVHAICRLLIGSTIALAFATHAQGQTAPPKAVVIGSLESRPNAILFLNPEDKDQGFLLPQLTTAQRLSIQAASPGDDGLMVYDKQENDVYLWRNNAWAKAKLGEGGAASQVINTIQFSNNEIRINEAGIVHTQSLNAMQVNGDVFGAINATKVGKIQGNAVNNTKLTPADNGKVLAWDGTQWVAQTIASASPATQYTTVDPSAFSILKERGKADKGNIAIFEEDDSFVTIYKTDEAKVIIAPVSLPQGATLQNVTLHYMVRQAGNIRFRLLRKTLSGGNEELVNWVSTGVSNAVRTNSFATFNGKQVIQNNGFSYRIEITLNPPDEADEASKADHRIYGVGIQYMP